MEKTEFKKSLNLMDSTSLVIGSMIGSGIFIVSADMARNLGSPGWLIIAWVITGIMTVFAALSYGELAAMFPKAGGQYVYLREAYNPLTGFLYGWTLFMVIQTGTIAAVGVAFGKFAGVLFPPISTNNIIADFAGLKINTVQLTAILSIITLTIINLFGIKIGKNVQNLFTFTKAGAIFLLLIAGLFFFSDPNVIQKNTEIFWSAASIKNGIETPLSGFAIIAALGVAMVGSVFSADAWNNVTFTSSEIKNPQKNIPRALFLGTSIVILIYIIANIVYINLLPFRGNPAGLSVMERGLQFSLHDRVGIAAMSRVMNSAEILMAILIIISTFGCNNGLILSGARVYYAMSLDGLFFRGGALLNKRNVPARALLYQCVWSCLLCLSGTYGDLLDYVVVAALLFYILTISGIFILRIKQPDTPRPYKAFAYPFVPFIYILLAGSMIIILLFYKPNYTLPGLIIVLLGVPVYFAFVKMKRK